MINKAFEKWWSESDHNKMMYRAISSVYPRHHKYIIKHMTIFARTCFVAGWIASSYNPKVKESKDDNS
jgi:hypothetical protein